MLKSSTIRVGLSLTLLVALVAGCSGTGGGRRNSTGPSALGEIEEDIPSSGDYRVVFFQANNAQTMIVVNRGHSLRGTEKGRKRLALNFPGQGYKPLSEKAMAAMMVTLKERRLDALATAFQRGDERYFERNAVPGYRGMLLVEQNGAMRKVLGIRPRGRDDILGQERYLAFVKLKEAFLYYHNSQTETETPAYGRTALGS